MGRTTTFAASAISSLEPASLHDALLPPNAPSTATGRFYAHRVAGCHPHPGAAVLHRRPGVRRGAAQGEARPYGVGHGDDPDRAGRVQEGPRALSAVGRPE